MIAQLNDMFHDYFGVVFPDAFVQDLLNSDDELREEVSAGAAGDTVVRELAIALATKKLGICMKNPNMFGIIGAYDWPCYGDSDEYKQEFFVQFAKAVNAAGGQLAGEGEEK